MQSVTCLLVIIYDHEKTWFKHVKKQSYNAQMILRILNSSQSVGGGEKMRERERKRERERRRRRRRRKAIYI